MGTDQCQGCKATRQGGGRQSNKFSLSCCTQANKQQSVHNSNHECFGICLANQSSSSSSTCVCRSSAFPNSAETAPAPSPALALAINTHAGEATVAATAARLNAHSHSRLRLLSIACKRAVLESVRASPPNWSLVHDHTVLRLLSLLRGRPVGAEPCSAHLWRAGACDVDNVTFVAAGSKTDRQHAWLGVVFKMSV